MRTALVRTYTVDPDQLTNEIVELAEAAGYDPVVFLDVKMDRSHPRHYLREGKLDELINLIEEHEIQKVVVDDQLKPHQAFALEEQLKIDVLDKPMIILEIFELRANSKDIKMQINLAQLKYSVPRMVTEMGEAVRSERPGYGGSGEQVTDILVSDMNRRIRKFEEKIEAYRKQYSNNLDSDTPRLPIVGYYSVGKSTLFNILTESERDVGQEAFTTMVLKTSRSDISGYPIDFIDTVGLVDLPTDILSAFDLMLTSIFSFSGMILCLNASLSFEDWRLQLLDYKDYLDKFTRDQTPRVIVALTKMDLVDDYDKILKMKSYIHKQDWLHQYRIIETRKDKSEKVQEDFIHIFEDLFADDLTQFVYQHLSPSTASKLHNVSRIEDQEWHSDGTTSLTGVGPTKLINQYKGEILK